MSRLLDVCFGVAVVVLLVVLVWCVIDIMGQI